MDSIYIHDKNISYPDKDCEHMIKSEKAHDYTYDADFMYRLKGFKYRFVRTLIRILMIILVQPVCAVRYALKVTGRRNIRKYFRLTDTKGMISVCNHTTEWDSIFVMITRYFRFDEFPVWQEGVESKSGMLYRLVGGIPMPKSSLKGMGFAFRAMRDVVNEGKWLHVFPEAACWAFYPAVRSFQQGAFQLAYELNKPVLPMAVKYRAPGGIYRLFKKHPNACILIGEPLEADCSLPKHEAVADLTERARLSVMNLLGIENEEENAKIRGSLKTYHVE